MAESNSNLESQRQQSLERLTAAKLEVHKAKVAAEETNHALIKAGLHNQIIMCW